MKMQILDHKIIEEKRRRGDNRQCQRWSLVINTELNSTFMEDERTLTEKRWVMKT